MPIKGDKFTTHEHEAPAIKFTTDTGDSKPSDGDKFNKSMQQPPKTFPSKNLKTLKSGKSRVKIKTKIKPGKNVKTKLKPPKNSSQPITKFFKTSVRESESKITREQVHSKSQEPKSDSQLCTLPRIQLSLPSSEYTCTQPRISSTKNLSLESTRLVHQDQPKQR